MPDPKASTRNENKKRLGRVISVITVAVLLFTGLLLLPSIYLSPVWSILMMGFLFFMFFAATDLALDGHLNRIFPMTIFALMVMHPISGMYAFFPSDYTQTGNPEALVQYANENSYSEILLEDDKHPKFRTSEGNEFQEATKRVTRNALLYRQTHDVHLFQETQGVSLSDLGLEDSDNCREGVVNQEVVQVCQQQSPIGSLIVSLNTNGDIESAVVE